MAPACSAVRAIDSGVTADHRACVGDRDEDRKLRSFTGVGQSIGTWIAGLEQLILHRREPPAISIQEHDRVEQASRAAGLTWTDEPVERPEPPDTTGARL